MRNTRLFAVAGAVALVSGLAFTGIASADDEDFRTQMTGAQEVPPADPDGSARGKVELDVEAGEVCFKFSWKNIATPTLGHIHNEVAGVNGPIVVDLLGGIPPDTLEADDDVRGCVSADPMLLTDIIENPDQYYLNLHNPRFPSGAVRGQLG
jgi:hypothetical protein